MYEDDGINLYFGDICVQLGTDITTEKMAQISPIIAKLEGKSGVLHLEHYENDSNVITFSEEEADESSEDDTTSEDDATLEDDTNYQKIHWMTVMTHQTFRELIMENSCEYYEKSVNSY